MSYYAEREWNKSKGVGSLCKIRVQTDVHPEGERKTMQYRSFNGARALFIDLASNRRGVTDGYACARGVVRFRGIYLDFIIIFSYTPFSVLF